VVRALAVELLIFREEFFFFPSPVFFLLLLLKKSLAPLSLLFSLSFFLVVSLPPLRRLDTSLQNAPEGQLCALGAGRCRGRAPERSENRKGSSSDDDAKCI